MRMGRWRIPCVWPKVLRRIHIVIRKNLELHFLSAAFSIFGGTWAPKGISMVKPTKSRFRDQTRVHQKATLFLKDMKKKCQKNGCSITNLFLQNGSTDSTVYCWSLNLALSNLAFFQYQDRYESMKVIGERQATAAKTIFERATTPLGATKWRLRSLRMWG